MAQIIKQLRRQDVRVIAVDFDGCLCSDEYPHIGYPNMKLIAELIELQRNGKKLIFWTCRSDEELLMAIRWCDLHGLYFDAVNDNVEDNIEKYGNNCRKVNADIYLDDKAVRIRYGRQRWA